MKLSDLMKTQQEQTAVDANSLQILRAKLEAQHKPRTILGRMRYPAFAIGLGLACLLVFLNAQTPENPAAIPFIRQAIAAAEDKANNLQAGQVRYIVKSLERDDIPGWTREEWTNAEGVTVSRSTNSGTEKTREFITTPDGAYVTPQEAEADRQSHEAYIQWRNEEYKKFPVSISYANIVYSFPDHLIACRPEDVIEEEYTLTPVDELEMKLSAILGEETPTTATPHQSMMTFLLALESSPLIQDVGESTLHDLGAVHVYRLSHQKNRTNDPAKAYTEGVDYIFDADAKLLVRVSRWADVPENWYARLTYHEDTVVDQGTLPNDFFDPTARGYVLAPRYTEEVDPRRNVVLEETGCFKIDNDDLSVTKVAETLAEAREQGFVR